jgi:hypothetical protein
MAPSLPKMDGGSSNMAGYYELSQLVSKKRRVATAYETCGGGNMFLMRKAPFDGAFKARSCE